MHGLDCGLEIDNPRLNLIPNSSRSQSSVPPAHNVEEHDKAITRKVEQGTS